jgi:hypothetical protein
MSLHQKYLKYKKKYLKLKGGSVLTTEPYHICGICNSAIEVCTQLSLSLPEDIIAPDGHDFIHCKFHVKCLNSHFERIIDDKNRTGVLTDYDQSKKGFKCPNQTCTHHINCHTFLMFELSFSRVKRLSKSVSKQINNIYSGKYTRFGQRVDDFLNKHLSNGILSPSDYRDDVRDYLISRDISVGIPERNTKLVPATHESIWTFDDGRANHDKITIDDIRAVENFLSDLKEQSVPFGPLELGKLLREVNPSSNTCRRDLIMSYLYIKGLISSNPLEIPSDKSFKKKFESIIHRMYPDISPAPMKRHGYSSSPPSSPSSHPSSWGQQTTRLSSPPSSWGQQTTRLSSPPSSWGQQTTRPLSPPYGFISQYTESQNNNLKPDLSSSSSPPSLSFSPSRSSRPSFSPSHPSSSPSRSSRPSFSPSRSSRPSFSPSRSSRPSFSPSHPSSSPSGLVQQTSMFLPRMQRQTSTQPTQPQNNIIPPSSSQAISIDSIITTNNNLL